MSKPFTIFLIAILAVGLLAPVTNASSKSLLTPMNASEPFCGNTATVPLLRNANKGLVSGTVTVANGETTLFVTYTTTSPWTLVKSDLAVASSLAGIPVTSKGNPKVDQFPYRSSHAGITTYTYEIPLSGLGNTIYIAAHADLLKSGATKTEGAWADGTPFVPGKRSWGMYFIYTVQTCNQPPIAVDDTATIVEDDPATTINVLANDSDPDFDPFTIASASDPANGTVVVALDGLSLTYEPDANYCNDGSPTDDFTYTLAPGGATATVFVTVTCVDDLPVAVNDSATVAEGAAATTINVLANDTDAEGNAFSITSVTQPANGTVVNNGTDLTYQPNAGYCNDGSPTDDFAYTLTPGGSTATVAVTVVCVDNAPVAVDDTATVGEDSGANTIDVLANDVDPDNGPKSISSVTQPANGTVVITNGGADLTYEPNSNYCYDGATDDFTYALDPGGDTATVSVTVTCVDDAPTAVDDTATVGEDSGATTINVLANDTDPDGGINSITSVTQPTNGTVVITNGGADLTYEPNANYCNDGSPTDDFTYTLTPGGSTATVTVTVTCVDDPVTAFDDTATVAEDSGATTIDVLANDTDPDGGSGSFSIDSVTQPTNGTVAITNGGADLTYTPNANYCNDGSPTDDFTYTLTPGGSTATVAVTVTCVNDAPAMTAGGTLNYTENQSATAIDATITVSDVDNTNLTGATAQIIGNCTNAEDVLSFTTQSGISGVYTAASCLMTLSGSSTVANYQAALRSVKYNNTSENPSTLARTVTWRVDDGGAVNNLSNTPTSTINVTAVNDAPVAQNKTGIHVQANMKRVGIDSGLLTGVTDADNGVNGCTSTPFSVASITQVSGGTVSNVSLATGTFDFDPNPGFTGTAVVNYTVSDNGCPGSATSAPATISITVDGPVIWFVNNAVAGPGAGTLFDPFKTLASADAVDAANHRIFLYSGTYASGITLNTNEWLIGQGVTGAGFDTLFGITPPTGTIARPSIGGTRPVVQGNVAMATSDAVRGLNIQPASGTAGLTATSATSLTVGEVSVTTSNAAAVNLSSSGGTISLTTVNANGGSNGIVLNNTTGTFTVAGTGGTCTEANTSGCTGGIIQNMAGGDDSSATPIGTGIVLNNAAGVSLTRMYIHDHSNYGIRGNGVNGFALDTSVVNGVNGTNVSTPFNDGSISFDNLSGTASIANSAIAGGYQRNIRVDNTTGTLTLTVNSSSIHNTGNVAGDDGLFVEIGGGTATLTVTNNTFAAHGGDHFNLSLLGTPTVSLTFTGNAWTGGHPIGLGQGLFILAASFNSPGTFTYNISNNGTALTPLVGNRQGGAMHVNKGSGTGSFSGTISGNFIGDAAVNGSGSSEASGIDVEAHGSGGSHTTVISNNTVRQFHNDGILILAGEGSATLNATVTGNTVTNPDASVASLHGLHFNIGTLPTDNMLACLHVANNSLTTAGNEANAGVDLRMRQRQLTTVRLPGYAGANNDNTAVQTFLTGTNLNSVTTILASNTVATGGGGFVGGAACPLP